MASESTSKVTIDGIPNNVSGDGKSFVAKLKQFLRGYSHNVEELIENSDNNANVSQVANLILAEHVAGGKSNIQVSFVTTNVVNYSFAQVWVRTSKTASWVQSGITSGTQYVIENATMGATYYVKVVACSKESGFANFDRAPEQEITIRGGITICNTPTQFYWDNASKRWAWGGYVDNGATDFFELRLDENPGVWDSNRLDSTTNMYSTIAPPNRSGTAYLYVRNVYGQYNLPAVHIYSVTGLSKPTAPTLKATVDGVVIDLQGLPSGAYEYVVDVDGTEFEITSQQWTYYKFSGSITVKYCFVDSIGRSEWSNTATLAVGRQLGSNDIAANAITAGKIATNAVTADKINAGAITAGKIAADAIKIGGTGSNVTIADGAINGSKITSNTIIGDKIASNTITASKLAAETINLSDSLQIAAGAVTLNDVGMTCAMNDGSAVNFGQNGITYVDKNGVGYAGLGRIAAGTARHGQRVNLSPAWPSAPNVIVMPKETQITVPGYHESNTKLRCYATNITNSGFTIQCFLELLSGSASSILTFNELAGKTTGSQTVEFITPAGTTSTTIQVELTGTAGVYSSFINETYSYGYTQLRFTLVIKRGSTQIATASGFLGGATRDSYSGAYSGYATSWSGTYDVLGLSTGTVVSATLTIDKNGNTGGTPKFNSGSASSNMTGAAGTTINTDACTVSFLATEVINGAYTITG